jgi:hypothetical protein
VGVAIEHRWQLASLPPALNEAVDVATGVNLINNSIPCISIFNGMWERPNATYPELLEQAARLLSSMLMDRYRTEISIASLMAVWHDKAMRSLHAPPDDLASLAILIRNAALALPKSSVHFSARIWKVYFHLAAHTKRNPLDDESFVEAVSMVACAAANHDINPQNFSRRSLGTFLRMGLKYRAAGDQTFKMSYGLWRKALTSEMGISSPTFSHPGSPMRAKPNYSHRWQGGDELVSVRWVN